MKLLKRLALPVMALFVLTVVGCNKQSADEGGEGLREGDEQSLTAKRNREEANTKLQANYLRVGQALSLTQMGIQSKLHGNASLDGPAAPTGEVPAAAPAGEPTAPPAVPEGAPAGEHGAAPAPAPEAAPAGEHGAAPAPAPEAAAPAPAGAPVAPGQPAGVTATTQPAAPVAPTPPAIIPQGTLANQMIGQAFSLLEEAKKDSQDLLAGALANEPRVVALRELMEAVEDLIHVAAGMEPVNADILALMAQAAQPPAPAPAAAPGAPAGEPGVAPGAPAGEPGAMTPGAPAPIGEPGMAPPAPAPGEHAPAPGYAPAPAAPAPAAPAPGGYAPAPAAPAAPAPPPAAPAPAPATH